MAEYGGDYVPGSEDGHGFVESSLDPLANTDEMYYSTRNTPTEQPYGYSIGIDIPGEEAGDPYHPVVGFGSSSIVHEVAAEGFLAGTVAAAAILGSKLGGSIGTVVGAIVAAVIAPRVSKTMGL